MKKIAVHGSYFGYNFGDTLLCALFRQWIQVLHPDAKVILPLASRRNLELIGGDARGLVPFLSCPDLVFCGGGYFGGPATNSTKWSVRNFLRHFVLAEMAMLLRKRIFILGTGMGPISSPFLRKRLRRLAEYAECVIVRDQESKDFLASLGVTRRVDVDVDAAMYLEPEFFAASPPLTYTSSAPSGSRVVAIHLTNFDAAYWDEMAQQLAEFCRAHDHVISLLITDSLTRSGKSTPQDKAFERLQRLIPTAQHADYDGDPRALCRRLEAVDLIVTNKLHVGIVGVVLGKQVIALPQHVKTPRFYRQLGLSDICVTDNQAIRLRELLEQWLCGDLPAAVLHERENVYLNRLSLQLGAAP